MTKEKKVEKEDFVDLKPQRRRKVKEPAKPWGKKERNLVLFTLLFTVLTSAGLSLSARNWKLPGLKKIELPSGSDLNPFKEQVVIVGNDGFTTNQEKIKKIKSDFVEATDSYSGIYAFYVYDLNGNYFYGENYQEVLTAASLIKLPVMELAFKKLESGDLTEEEALPLLEAMGKKSDNSAYLEMVKILGEDEVNREIRDLGMINTSLDDNETTPEEVGIFFKKLYNRELLNEKYTSLFFEYLTDTIWEDWLTPGIPDGIPLAHKYGREAHSVSDAGVVFDSKPFVVVIMTDGVIETEADELFPSLSKLLYNGHTGETN
jgi:beta-lactamase class A